MEGAFDAGSVVAHIKADLSDFNSGIENAKGEISSFGDNVSNVVSDIKNFAMQAGLVVGAQVLALKSLGGFAIDTASNLEQTRIELDAMTGSADKGAKAMSTLNDFAKKAPLIPVQDIMDAGKQLLAFGFTLDGTTSKMGDVASSTTKANVTVDAFGNTVTKVSKNNESVVEAANVKLKEQNAQLKILEEEHPKAGLATEKHDLAVMKLKDSIAKTTETIGTHTLTTKQMTVATGEATQSIGSLDQLLQEAGEAAIGMGKPISQIIDIFNAAKEGIFNQRMFGAIGAGRDELTKFGVAFDDAGKLVDKSTLLPGLEKLIQSRFGDIFGKEANTFGGSVQNIKDDVARLAAAFMGVDAATGKVRDGSLFAELEKGANAIFKFLDAHMDMIKKIGENKTVQMAIEGLVLALASLAVIIPVVLIAMNPIVLAILAIEAAVVLLYMAWRNNWGGIRDTANSVIKEIVNFWDNYLKPAVKSVTDWIQHNWESITLITKGAWEMVSNLIKGAWDFVYGLLKIGFDLLNGNWKQLWTDIKSLVSNVWGDLQNIFKGMITFIEGWAGDLYQKLIKPFTDAWHTITDLVSKIKNALDFTQRHSPSVVDIVENGVKLVNDALGGLAFNNQFNVNPHAAFSNAAVGGGTISNQIHVHLDGAVIADNASATRVAEKIGDSIIKKLQLNIRV